MKEINWRLFAACRSLPTDMFFLPKDASRADIHAAKAVCATCPAKAACLEHALIEPEIHGIWGGTSERERRKLRRQRELKPVKVGGVSELCGSVEGYEAHQKLHRPVCDACKDAWAAAHAKEYGCGTDAGYQVHMRASEPPCDPCRKAHTKVERRRARRRAERQAAQQQVAS